MAADPKIVALQAVLNRYPSTNPTLVPDGLLGDKTAGALVKALAYIASNNAAARDTATALTNSVVAGGAYNFLQIRQSAEGLTTYLNDRADDAKLTLIQTSFTPTTKTTAASDPSLVLAHNKQNVVAAAAKQATQHIPPWAMYASGAALIVAAIGATAFSIKKGKRSGPSPSAAVTGWGGASVTNREGLTWEEWRDAAKFADRTPGMHPEKVKAWRKAWRRGEDPTEAGQS